MDSDQCCHLELFNSRYSKSGINFVIFLKSGIFFENKKFQTKIWNIWNFFMWFSKNISFSCVFRKIIEIFWLFCSVINLKKTFYWQGFSNKITNWNIIVHKRYKHLFECVHLKFSWYESRIPLSRSVMIERKLAIGRRMPILAFQLPLPSYWNLKK